MRRPRLRLLFVLVGAIAAGALLRAAGDDDLRGPSGVSWGAGEAWYEGVGAGAVAVAGARLAGLLAAAWLGATAALQLVVGLCPIQALQQWADAVSPRMLRPLGHGMVTLSLTVGLGGPPAPTDPPGTAVMEALDADPEPAPPSTTAPRPPPTPPAPAPAPTERPEPAREVVVARGDSFWSLAEAHVVPGARPAALAAYWRRFVDANRPRLVDPANPDLLYAGQVLTLPPPDA